MVKKKSELDLDYKPPKWKPGEAVVVLLSWDSKTYLVGGYEVFNDEKEHSLCKGCAPITLSSTKQPRYGELLVTRKGQKGRPVRRKNSEVFKLSDVPKDTVYSFEEVFGYAGGVTVVAGSYVKSEQEDLNFGIAPVVEEIIEE
jgi:hypothetical protein